MKLPLTVTVTDCLLHGAKHDHCSVEDADGLTIVHVASNTPEADCRAVALACNLFDELVGVATEFLAVCHVTGRYTDAERVRALIAKCEAQP